MITPPTNQRQRTTSTRYHDLDADETMLLDECMNKIKKHINRNIELAKTADQAARMLAFRSYIF